jgi:hypothetical protein
MAERAWSRVQRPGFLWLVLSAALWTAPVAGQVVLERPLRVYLDCSGFRCDADYFVEQVPWVDFVVDRQDADVHVLATRQSTGAGGGSYIMEFRGQQALEGDRLTLSTVTEPDATAEGVRSALAGLVQRGLAPFASSTSVSPRVEILPPEETEGEATTTGQDPWNRWRFRVSVNSLLNGESQQRFLNTSGNVSAARVTDAWKWQLALRGSLSESEFELDDTTRFITTQHSYSGSMLAARSVGPQWALGGVVSWRRSTFANYDHSVRVAPAVEYNLYPYGESNRRLFTVLYAVGPRHNAYETITLFQETSETLVEQQLIVTYDVTQPWGSVDASMRTSHYLTKFGDGEDWPDPQYNIELFANLDIRLVRGLSASLFGNVEMVRGQIQLAAVGLTPEEILTQQRELATDYRYFMGFGLSYQFGSIFTHVVNRRFEDLD